MPDILIETRKGWLGGNQRAFAEAIHGAVVAILESPEDDKVVRLIEHESDLFLVPGSVTTDLVHIEITLLEGRSLDKKRDLYRAITSASEGFGIAPTDVKIILHEVRRENVGMRGGQAAPHIKLGYQI